MIAIFTQFKAYTILSMAAFLLTIGMAGQAQARDGDDHGRGHAYGHDREWREHERRAHYWHARHPVMEPEVVYAPPAVVYAPPPVSNGLTLVIPFDIR